MSEDLLKEAPFLSVSPPKESIIDYSQQLSGQAKQALTQQCQTLNYKAKVVILPADFSPGSAASFDTFSQELAKQWHVSGNRFLLLVDLKGHHVRGLSGDGLQNLGVSSDFISSAVIHNSFLPQMRKGDLQGAISSALSSINNKSLSRSDILQTSSTPPTKTEIYRAANTDAAAGSYAFLFFLLISFALVAGLAFACKRAKKQQSRALYDSLKGRLDSLYARADAISQAAEYLSPAQNADLASDLAKFFNRIGALNTAQNELERLEKAGKVESSFESLRKVDKMTDMLIAESGPLQEKVNAATGTVQNIRESGQEVAQKFEQEAMEAIRKEDQENERLAAQKREQIAEQERFRRPSWSYDSAYYQPVVLNDPWAGVRDFMLVTNQMEMNHRLQEMNYDMQHHGHAYASADAYDDNRQSWGNAGGSWDDGSASQTDSSDSAWGDSGGDSTGSDGGWGDCGGDFFGGDGGGDW